MQKKGFYQKWTQEEEDILKSNYPTFGSEKCSELLNRTRNKITTKAFHLNLSFTRISKDGNIYCESCRSLKPRNNFRNSKEGISGLAPNCIECEKKIRKKKYESRKKDKKIKYRISEMSPYERDRHRRRRREWKKKRMAIDKNYKILNILRNRMYIALKGLHKIEKTIQLLGCDLGKLWKNMGN